LQEVSLINDELLLNTNYSDQIQYQDSTGKSKINEKVNKK